jgi:hypothetical protein
MTETAPSVLAHWSNFYVMTGSAAAALTGLMFVVITLVSGEERLRNSPDGISTFSTPTVLHFCSALFVSVTLCAPWPSLIPPAALLGLGGLFCIGYVVRVSFLQRRLSTYKPDLEDWVWFTILPFAAYAAILAGAVALFADPAAALFALAGGAVLLIFIGIRNSWDVVTYIAVGSPKDPAEADITK